MKIIEFVPSPEEIASTALFSSAVAVDRKSERALSGEPSTTERSPRWRVEVSSWLFSASTMVPPISFNGEHHLHPDLELEADTRHTRRINQAEIQSKKAQIL
jgi:hypothetical protein